MWLALDWNSITELVEIPSMYSEPQEEVQESQTSPSKSRKQKTKKKVRDKRTLLQTTKPGPKDEEQTEEEGTEAFFVSEPREVQTRKRLDWESSSGTELSEDDPELRRR
eukprot:Gregarina_sp_Poly_1__11531@NODE_9_length_23536_cov_120_681324_g8_i0_p22_GENE_NODE_9_length_23536_cov_120_681324_g8_i0NODE_9_length_23536_cov_120_681324_g8_i0_p22_ORF_typecomplete_len109_score24_75DUF4661/PF15576_6/0_75_NODE_9_length_23536_cov_120_681324_g8_i02310423430